MLIIPKVFRLEDSRSAADQLSLDAVMSPLGWSLLGLCSLIVRYLVVMKMFITF